MADPQFFVVSRVPPGRINGQEVGGGEVIHMDVVADQVPSGVG